MTTPTPPGSDDTTPTLTLELRPLTDPPAGMDASDNGRASVLLNWVATGILLACHRTDDREPTPLQFIGEALPHQRLLDLAHAGVAAMALNACRAAGDATLEFEREVVAQALHREARCPIDPARARAAIFVERVEADDDDLEFLRATTREGFTHLAEALAENGERAGRDTEALREIAIGARLMMGTVLEVLVSELETILTDLGVDTDPARTDAYRTTLLGILENIRGGDEGLTNPTDQPQG
jgi:hypothetical protein